MREMKPDSADIAHRTKPFFDDAKPEASIDLASVYTMKPFDESSVASKRDVFKDDVGNSVFYPFVQPRSYGRFDSSFVLAKHLVEFGQLSPGMEFRIAQSVYGFDERRHPLTVYFEFASVGTFQESARRVYIDTENTAALHEFRSFSLGCETEVQSPTGPFERINGVHEFVWSESRRVEKKRNSNDAGLFMVADPDLSEPFVFAVGSVEQYLAALVVGVAPVSSSRINVSFDGCDDSVSSGFRDCKNSFDEVLAFLLLDIAKQFKSPVAPRLFDGGVYSEGDFRRGTSDTYPVLGKDTMQRFGVMPRNVEEQRLRLPFGQVLVEEESFVFFGDGLRVEGERGKPLVDENRHVVLELGDSSEYRLDLGELPRVGVSSGCR